MVLMDLVKIIIHENRDHQYIFLQERGGKRCFPIVIGIFEAMAIDRKVKDVRTPRPMTHDLLGSVIEALSAKLDWIVVNKLEHNTFYARLVLSQDGRTIEVDSRPSDAIALAVQCDVPIYVEEEVLDEVLKSGEV